MRTLISLQLLLLLSVAVPSQRAFGDDPASEQGETQGSKKAAEQRGQTAAAFTVNKKTYKLKHAVAFQGHWFDERVPTVLFCEKPIPLEKLKAAVKKGFDEQEMLLLSLGRFLVVRFESPEEPTVSGWADNLSLGSTHALTSKASIKDQRIRGTIAMPEPEELGPFKFHFEMKFDLSISKFE